MDEGKLCKGSHEKEYDQRIGEGDKKRRQSIVEQRSLTFVLRMMRHLLGRVRTKAEETKKQQDNATRDLEKELVLGILQRSKMGNLHEKDSD